MQLGFAYGSQFFLLIIAHSVNKATNPGFSFLTFILCSSVFWFIGPCLLLLR